MEISKFIGALIGLAVGDSLGAPMEGSPYFREIRELGPSYTDDTAMMIGVAESLIESSGFNAEHMAKRFLENYEKEPWRGYGGPQRIFKMMREGARWDEELDKRLYPGGSFGNGSAMRAAPVGLFYHNDPEKLREVAYKASRITHSHPLAMEGAALQAYAVALALEEETDLLNKLMEFTGAVYKKKLECINELLDKKENRTLVVREPGNGIEAFNSVPTAIYSFLANSSFEDALVYAVSLGGDADTIGAMTGAIAGACWGIEKIPSRWRSKLENRQYIEKLGEGLWKVASKRDLNLLKE